MEENNSQADIPHEILGLPVIGMCPECMGEGMLWGFSEETHWANRCQICNCIGFILDLSEKWKRQPNDFDIPF